MDDLLLLSFLVPGAAHYPNTPFRYQITPLHVILLLRPHQFNSVFNGRDRP